MGRVSDAGPTPPRLHLDGILAAARVIDPVFLHSPQFRAAALGDAVGVDLSVKVESLNPIRSFKARGAETLVDAVVARTGGAAPVLVCASAGNFGQGMAWAARRRGLRSIVFAALGASAVKLERMRALGAEVRLEGHDFDAAKDAARAYGERAGHLYLEDGREPEVALGAGTIALELLELPARPALVALPLGNGALLAGVATALRALAPDIRIAGVVARGAPAMGLSLAAGRPVATDTSDTIADGIAVRVPVPEAVADLADLVDEIWQVGDDVIVDAMRLAHRHLGVVVEPAGVAGLAALLDRPERARAARAATVLCGGNLTDEQAHRWLCS